MQVIPSLINDKPKKIGKFIPLDILCEKRVNAFHIPNQNRIEKNIYMNNKLFMSCFDFVIVKIKTCSTLSSYKLIDFHISILYSREYDEYYDLSIEFFSRIEGTYKYMFFEVQLNTVHKIISDKSPKINFIACYILDNEFNDPNMLINYAISALKSDDRYLSYQIKNIILARYIYGELINPEKYSILAVVQEKDNSIKNALITFSVESSSRLIFLADVSFLDDIDNKPISNEIPLDIELEMRILSKNNFKIKDKNKFLDLKSSDLLLEFIEKKICSSKVLKDFKFNKSYINSIEKRKNSLNDYEYMIEFLKQAHNFEFILFHVCVNAVSNNFKLSDIKCFRLEKLESFSKDDEKLVAEALLTLEEEHELRSVIFISKMASITKISHYYSFVNIFNVKKKENETGYLLFYKRIDSIAIASSFIKSSNINDDGLIPINPNLYRDRNEILLTDKSVLKSSKKIQLALKFIEEKNILNELAYNNNLIDLIHSAKIKYEQSKDYIELLFITVHKDDRCFFIEINLICQDYSLSNFTDLQYKLIKLEKSPLIEIKENLLNKKYLQVMLDRFDKEKWNILKGALICDLNQQYMLKKGKKLQLRNFGATSFRFKKDGDTKYGFMTFLRKSSEVFPVCFYEMNEKFKFIDHNHPIIDHDLKNFKGKYLLNCQFLTINSSNLNSIGPDCNYSVILFPQSKSTFKLTEKYNDLIISKLKENIKTLESTKMDSLLSFLKSYNGAYEIVSYLSLIHNDELIITELCLGVKDMLENKFELNSMYSFMLKPIELNDNQKYELIKNIIWANSLNKLYKNIIITKVRNFTELKKSSCLTSIHLIEFKTNVSKSEYSLLYGVSNTGKIMVLKQISVLNK